MKRYGRPLPEPPDDWLPARKSCRLLAGDVVHARYAYMDHKNTPVYEVVPRGAATTPETIGAAKGSISKIWSRTRS